MSPRWKVVIALTAVLAIFTCLSLFTANHGPQTEVEAYKQSLIARGEKLKMDELIPSPAPPEQNGASLLQTASSLFSSEMVRDSSNLPPMMQIAAPGKAIIGWTQPVFHLPIPSMPIPALPIHGKTPSRPLMKIVVQRNC